ncbi:chromosome segregation protein SMC [Amnimonas aquatica]|uniref:Chromosome partition protein Smc n=1 Tax=Amnimonas aquatica TaxID=2094561 RepID=A0A2P6ATV0_9GAMM|nr:chromosome segregation protein SMC [Amnimonas aquatica]PQA48559.1 chromosome segregation protein SMC [Amnimonas aquatica]
MRLKTIKLAGFKSFVDPTSAHFPTNLSAVVGPNGCGKSNIIDAVRWVMGESSAKNLRGENMTDVIFNGSTGRKPVGQASIELVFDNADGSLGGEYAQYAEISIKRVVTREARSDYFLNGTRCRRKDITDIFLGTGLGPRSYAIIEQGMISRLIESKPEELRVYIEEAAGISKYKERRRETENRMRHTRENLDRLNDIREELGKQLTHLEKQARDAEKYKELKEEERILRAQLYALRWRALDAQVSQHETAIRDLEVRLEAAVAAQRELETTLVRDRETQFALSDEFNNVQSRYYQLGSEIARVQQAQRYRIERLAEVREALASVERQSEQARQLLEHDRDELAQAESEHLALAPAAELQQAEAEAAAEQLAEAEVRLADWQQAWDQFNLQSQGPRQRAEVEQSRIQHMEQALRRGQERLARLEQEQAALSGGPLESELAELNAEAAEQKLVLEEAEERMAALVDAMQQHRHALSEAGAELDARRQALQALRGREASLQALQEAAEKGQLAVNQWLSERGIAGQALAEQLRVAGGWETAVETVLGPQLQSIQVESLQSIAGHLEALASGQVAFAEAGAASAGAVPAAGGRTLAGCIESGPAWLHELLGSVRVADSLADALAQRATLETGETIITREGCWIGSSWLRFRATRDDPTSGQLARRRELAQLQEEKAALEQGLADSQARQLELREALREAEQGRETQQRELTQRNRALGDLQAQIGARQVRLEQFLARRERIGQDMQEVQRQSQLDQESLAEARLTLQEALEVMSQDTRERETRLAEREQFRMAVEQARLLQRERRDALHRHDLRMQALAARIQGLGSGLQRLEEQAEGLRERREALNEQILELSVPSGEDGGELETLLAQHVEAEQALAEVRERVEAVQNQLREAEQGRMRADQQVQIIRDSLQSLRLEWQNALARREAQLEQLQESEAVLDDVLASLPPTATESEWQMALERVGIRVTRLGAINLAAIDEYQAQAERKTYLDQQDADLQEALETLENAIRKIDRETRALFKETFDKVNAGLQDLFPKVFGGGTAYLELTDEDLLEAGVSIMARPPGKRNSTIHLLSGGEKALTALSLVFSIFRLNPAPFCMLDEVDAPLDDANVGRFARLVEQMSEQVQFIYITHNKIAMEMARQLMGVTMQEPGVSRLVSVNVDEAAALAGQ